MSASPVPDDTPLSIEKSEYEDPTLTSSATSSSNISIGIVLELLPWLRGLLIPSNRNRKKSFHAFFILPA